MVVPPPHIICVECDGRASLLTTWPPDDEPQPGDVIVYRCADCFERFDIVLAEEE